MVTLAEIADKMPSITQMWLWLGLGGIFLAVIGLIHRYAAFAAFGIGLLLSAVLIYESYYNAFVAPDFSLDIQQEMGFAWIVHSLLSTLCPVLFTGAVMVLHIKKRKSH